ncbi:CWF19-like protein 1 [Dinothrombium tinctorium]|uniref:CWF19-like protein 1 n=1 Tax=Dinothrombium tinctorium TaxID=1965070 RepID=A0A3S3NWQ1_9ACAR|nr:CWF19-like protein 1 [Dinothrombium tinctorium]RWS07445.1 CWF19-like protein 1 [Dinothrombium tinctorium]RWS07560.1 CWF19-like protein 1 [Dinothrombium tinctorium]
MAAKSSSTLIDVLITSQWPTDIERYLQVCPPGVRAISENGSQLISKLAYFIKPRYHFTSSSLFFERQPYRNHQVIQEMAKHVTRFISLADVGNKNKAKWIYAFNITPSHKIPRNELIKQSTDTTECPFTGLEYLKEQRDSESEEKPNQYFYDMSQNNNSYFGGKRRRGRHHDDPGKRKNDDKPKDPCWFCLASPDVEKHLIVSIGDHSYLAMAKGGLVDDHLLIIPIAHFRSMLEVAESDSNVLVEINKFKTALHDYFIKQDKIAVYFERNFRSSHLQIQVVPVPVNKSRDLKELLLELSEERDFKLNEVNEDLELKDVLSTGVPYFYIEIPAAKIKLFCKINAAKGFPLQFGRELLAHPRVLNLGDRIDWKDCVLDRNTAEEVTAQFRKNFEPFDFTL